jgi:hypothetical protein
MAYGAVVRDAAQMVPVAVVVVNLSLLLFGSEITPSKRNKHHVKKPQSERNN